MKEKKYSFNENQSPYVRLNTKYNEKTMTTNAQRIHNAATQKHKQYRNRQNQNNSLTRTSNDNIHCTRTQTHTIKLSVVHFY